MSLLKLLKSRRADTEARAAAASSRTDNSNLTESAVRPYTELPAHCYHPPPITDRLTSLCILGLVVRSPPIGQSHTWRRKDVSQKLFQPHFLDTLLAQQIYRYFFVYQTKFITLMLNCFQGLRNISRFRCKFSGEQRVTSPMFIMSAHHSGAIRLNNFNRTVAASCLE